MSDTPVKPLQPKRPGVATAAGIILIVFGSMCILSGIYGMASMGMMNCMSSLVDATARNASDRTVNAMQPTMDMMEYYRENLGLLTVYYLLLLANGVVGLVAGIFMMTLKNRGLPLGKISSIAQFVLVVFYGALQMVMMQNLAGVFEDIYSNESLYGSSLPSGFGTMMTSVMQGVSYSMVFIGSIIGIAIPVLVLIFVTRPKVREFYSRYGK